MAVFASIMQHFNAQASSKKTRSRLKSQIRVELDTDTQLEYKPYDTLIITCPNILIQNQKNYETRWYKNDKRINMEKNVKRLTFLDDKMSINGIQRGDHGNYSCEVITELGASPRSATLKLILNSKEFYITA